MKEGEKKMNLMYACPECGSVKTPVSKSIVPLPVCPYCLDYYLLAGDDEVKVTLCPSCEKTHLEHKSCPECKNKGAEI